MAKQSVPKRDPRIKPLSEVEAMTPKEKEEFRHNHGVTMTDEAFAKTYPDEVPDADKEK